MVGLALVLLAGPVGCKTPAMMQESAIPSTDSAAMAEEAAFLEDEFWPLENPEPQGLERWEVSGGLMKDSELDGSPIKPEIFNEEEYWEENAQRNGMVILDSGVQYLPVVEGRGLPVRNAPKVRVNYLVSRVTGQRVADSRLKDRGRPLEMEVAEMPSSWQAIIPRMKRGDIWRIFVPAEQAVDIDLPSGSYSFDIEMVEAFQNVSDWYSEYSVDEGADLSEKPDTQVSLAPEEESD